MMSYFSVGTFNIPVYGFLALMGTVVCNFIAMWISRADREKWKNYCLIEMVAGTGAEFGAKALTLLSDAVGGSGVGFTWENFKETGYSYYEDWPASFSLHGQERSGKKIPFFTAVTAQFMENWVPDGRMLLWNSI